MSFERITPDDFLDLLPRIEAEGGAHLSGTCKAKKIDALSKPNDPCYTHGCGEEMRFQLPYATENGTEVFAVLCAQGDRMDLWPRFQRPLESS